MIWFVSRSASGRLRITNTPPDNDATRFMSYNDALEFVRMEEIRSQRKRGLLELVVLLTVLGLISLLIP